MLPIPPLDGSRVVAAAMNEATYSRWRQLDQYGIFAIFGLLFIFRDQWSTLYLSVEDHMTRFIIWLVGG